VRTRVVSMPSWDLFAAQPDSYQDSVLPPQVPTLAVEAGASLGWDRWADDSVSLDRFGASAPGAVALHNLGFNPENVAERGRQLIQELQEDLAVATDGAPPTPASSESGEHR
jgi:transketolase